LQLDEYSILTTARKTTHGQNTIIRINRNHAATGNFKVFLWTWADIEAWLSEMDDASQTRAARDDPTDATAACWTPARMPPGARTSAQTQGFFVAVS
jgi:hypothetical protein